MEPISIQLLVIGLLAPAFQFGYLGLGLAAHRTAHWTGTTWRIDLLQQVRGRSAGSWLLLQRGLDRLEVAVLSSAHDRTEHRPKQPQGPLWLESCPEGQVGAAGRRPYLTFGASDQASGAANRGPARRALEADEIDGHGIAFDPLPLIPSAQPDGAVGELVDPSGPGVPFGSWRRLDKHILSSDTRQMGLDPKLLHEAEAAKEQLAVSQHAAERA